MTNADSDSKLVRGLTLSGTISLNMIDMIGVGPFITIPLIISAMGGPQAMVGWIIGAVIAMSDGLVWAELGAAMPGSGGTYRYLGELYGKKTGRLMSFLFIWQLIFSAPLSIASGCIGLAEYSSYFFPGLQRTFFKIDLPIVGTFHLVIGATGITLVGMMACAVAVVLLYRKITVINRIARYIWIVVMLTVAWVMIAGITHFSPSLAFDFPAGAFTLTRGFFLGLGSAMLISTYDYWGYYNVCFLGGEVRDPEKTIPRTIIFSISLVAVIYIIMNVCIIGVVPWRDLVNGSSANRYFVSAFMQKLYGSWGGALATVLIMWTAFASVFSLLLGYSRIPYAAASDGNFFRVFGKVHEKLKIPSISLLTLGGIALLFCFLSLAQIIAALVVIRILIQFISQTVGLLFWRIRNPESPRPFKMWLYPVPAAISLAGFIFILFSRQNFLVEIQYAAVIVLVGIVVYFSREILRRPRTT